MANLRILILEDDALIGELLSEMLIEMGHDVCAITATESGALAAAANSSPDLIVADAWIGTGSGLTAVDRIYALRPVPCLFVTGDPARITDLRPNAVVIQKPFREHDLVTGIQRAIDVHKLRVSLDPAA